MSLNPHCFPIARHLLPLLFFACPFVIQAQLCTGSLGDAVVNITFGNAAGVNPGVTPSASYSFTNSACPNDGAFTIATSSTGCFGNTWHNVSGDHTGGGAFMLVNASYDPGDFFLKTVTGLCPNTTYEFAAWVMNVINSPSAIEPNITFSIETTSGVILNQFNTAGIPSVPAPSWKQYGFFFTTNAGIGEVVLRMTNNAPGGIGNDLALDDITFRPCGPVLSSAIAGGSNTVDVCVNDQEDYSFSANLSTGFVSPVFQWQESKNAGQSWTDIPGANALTYPRQPTIAGNFLYRLTVAENGNAGIQSCRTASNLLTVNVHPRPVVNAGIDRTVIKGDEIILNGTSDGNNTYNWQPATNLSSSTTLNPVLDADGDITYSLTATSEFGCVNEDNVFIKVIAGIFVPTAFTPNNNSLNDYWMIPFLDPLSSTVRVFNRYGQQVYKSSDLPVKWDGKFKNAELPGGTYVYVITFGNNPRILKGTVTIIR